MATTTSKVIRIQDEEKEILFRLRKIYGNDYKKYSEHIKREQNISISIKKIYNTLDERQAYRRISDFFHRKRLATMGRRSYSNSNKKSRTSNRSTAPLPGTSSITSLDYAVENCDDDESNHTQNLQQLSNDSVTEDELDEAGNCQQHMTINSRQTLNGDEISQENQSDSTGNTEEQHQSTLPGLSQSVLHAKPSLLSIRASIQKALSELDRVIVPKCDVPYQENNSNTQRRQHQSIEKPTLSISGHNGSKLDDIVRSLSNAVSQQQDHVRLVARESSALLLNDNQQLEALSTTTQQSITQVLQRLNALIDRGHSIYDKVEGVLAKF